MEFLIFRVPQVHILSLIEHIVYIFIPTLDIRFIIILALDKCRRANSHIQTCPRKVSLKKSHPPKNSGIGRAMREIDFHRIKKKLIICFLLGPLI